jgi:uncharacterized protein YjdB
VVISSSNGNVASVNSKCVVKALSKGTAVITLKSASGCSVKCKVTVK